MNQFLSEVDDPRERWRVTYDAQGLLWCMILQRLGLADSARNWEDVKHCGPLLPNINALSGCDFEDAPHSDTLKYFAARLDPGELNKVLHKCFIRLRTDKRLELFKHGGYFRIAVDATEFHTSRHPLPRCCRRRLANGEAEYFQSALVVSLVTRSGIRIPLHVEFIENNEGAGEYDKQDCELKAFFRMAGKLRKAFPRQSFHLLLDSLYFTAGVIALLESHRWKYTIVWKDQAAPKFSALARKEIARRTSCRLAVDDEENGEKYVCSWCNGVSHKPAGAERGYVVNAFRAEGTFAWSEGKRSTFAFVTNQRLNKENIKEELQNGRGRWQIETTFNVQKNSELALERSFGTRKNVSLVYFMTIQIAFLIRTLMTSTNYFDKLLQQETTGSTLGSAMNAFARCHRSVKAFMQHLKISLLTQPIRLGRLPRGVHIVFNTS
jgi:YD repeat-containing protein